MKMLHQERYSYRLKQIDTDGNFEFSRVIEVEFGSEMNFELKQNFPNPFNPSTVIQYNIPEQSNVQIAIYNSLGMQIDIIENGTEHSGFYEKTWNAERFASGIYYARITVQSTFSGKVYSNVIKMLYVK